MGLVVLFALNLVDIRLGPPLDHLLLNGFVIKEHLGPLEVFLLRNLPLVALYLLFKVLQVAFVRKLACLQVLFVAFESELHGGFIELVVLRTEDFDSHFLCLASVEVRKRHIFLSSYFPLLAGGSLLRKHLLLL